MGILRVSALCVIVALVCAWCALRWRYRRARRMLAHLPSFSSLPILGNAHHLMGDGENALLMQKKVTKIYEKTSTALRFRLGPLDGVVALTDPEEIKMVSNVCYNKPYLYSFAKNYTGNGILTAPASIWKYTSKKLIGAFSPNMVDGYQDVFNKQVQNLVDSMRTEEGGEPFDVLHKYIGIMSLRSIYEVTTGASDTTELEFKEYHANLCRALELYAARGLNVFAHLDFMYRLTPSYRELVILETYMNNALDKVIYRRIAEREQSRAKGNYNFEGQNKVKGKVWFRSYLDNLLDLSETDPVFTHKQIRDEMNTLMFAGHETVATAIGMCFLMIGSHPDVQDKLYAEMKEIFGDSKRPVQKEDLSRMCYCEAVINETLRVHPSVPAVLRTADQDIEIKSCTVPEGAICVLSILGAGHNEIAWGVDAHLFRPDRWLQGRVVTDGTFIPFSVGKRTCIGKRYALVLLKTTLAQCVREFVIEANTTNLRQAFAITMQPISGRLIRIHPR